MVSPKEMIREKGRPLFSIEKRADNLFPGRNVLRNWSLKRMYFRVTRREVALQILSVGHLLLGHG